MHFSDSSQAYFSSFKILSQGNVFLAKVVLPIKDFIPDFIKDSIQFEKFQIS